MIDLVSGKRSVVLANAGVAQYLPGGYLLAMRNQNTLIAARFDLETLQVIGTPVAVWSGRPLGGFSVSPGGTLAMVTQSTDVSGRRLAWVDEQGQAQPIPGAPRAFGSIAVSPDGGRVATSLETPGQAELPSELWVHDLARRTATRLPTHGASWECIWSNDGQRIAFGVISEVEAAIWERRSDGSGEATKLYAVPNPRTLVIPKSWSPDGKTLAILHVDLASVTTDVLLLEQETGSKEWAAKPYLNSRANEDALGFSPDGKWVRFVSSESGSDQLYVQLDALEEGVSTVTVDILDLTGKRVSARTIPVQGDLLNAVIDLNGELTSGIYLVNITAGSEHFTQRLVIQH